MLATSDWDSAGHDYTSEHQRYVSVIHTSCMWLRQVLMEQGAEADRRRAMAMPLIAEDPTRIPDHIISGPELPIERQRACPLLRRAASDCAGYLIPARSELIIIRRC